MTSTKHRSIIQVSALGVTLPATDMSLNQWRCRIDCAAQGRSLRKRPSLIQELGEVARLNPRRPVRSDRALSGLNKYTGTINRPAGGTCFRGFLQ